MDMRIATLEEGREEERARSLKEKIEMAKAMLADGIMDIEQVCKYTHLTPEQLK